MMRKFLFSLSVVSFLFLGGCTAVSSGLLPDAVKESIAVNAAAARLAVADPPPQEYIDQYLQKNSEAWNELEEMFPFEGEPTLLNGGTDNGQ